MDRGATPAPAAAPAVSGDPDPDATIVRTTSMAPMPRAAVRRDWVHTLRVVEGALTGCRLRVGTEGVALGRHADSALPLPDGEISSHHCRVRALAGQPALEVTDAGSTNGTFVDGQRVRGRAALRDRGVLQVGRHVLLHEFLPLAEVEAAELADRDLARARDYVLALLPPPIGEGPVRTEWYFRPSAMLGGDAFGTQRIDKHRFAGYLIDVSGHGVGPSMHCVSVMNVLRQRALPETDFADPGQVLTRLNAMFPMEEHGQLCMTLWYGVYDIGTRELTYASAGHHPAYLREVATGRLAPLVTRSLAVGAWPDTQYRAERIAVAPASRLYIFSDGLFEFTDRQGQPRGLADFLPLLEASEPSAGEPERLFRAARAAAGGAPLEDDCSIVTVTFL